jgi:hypothetical protein
MGHPHGRHRHSLLRQIIRRSCWQTIFCSDRNPKSP